MPCDVPYLILTLCLLDEKVCQEKAAPSQGKAPQISYMKCSHVKLRPLMLFAKNVTHKKNIIGMRSE